MNDSSWEPHIQYFNFYLTFMKMNNKMSAVGMFNKGLNIITIQPDQKWYPHGFPRQEK